MGTLDGKMEDFAQEYSVLAVAGLYEKADEVKHHKIKPRPESYVGFDPKIQETLFGLYKTSQDPAIRNRLFENNKGLVYYTVDLHFPWIANQPLTKKRWYEDIVSEGNEALLDAIGGYDCKRGEFSTYAVTTIKNRIIGYLRDENRQRTTLSLDHESRDGLSLLGELSQTPDFSADDTDFLETCRGRLHKAMKILKPRDREIIERHYGMDGNEPETLDSMGKEWNITRAAVQAAKDRVLERLRTKLEHHYKPVFED